MPGQSPPNDAKYELSSATGVNVTVVPEVYAYWQAGGQAIPVGAPVTVPVPEPSSYSLSHVVPGWGLH